MWAIVSSLVFLLNLPCEQALQNTAKYPAWVSSIQSRLKENEIAIVNLSPALALHKLGLRQIGKSRWAILTKTGAVGVTETLGGPVFSKNIRESLFKINPRTDYVATSWADFETLNGAVARFDVAALQAQFAHGIEAVFESYAVDRSVKARHRYPKLASAVLLFAISVATPFAFYPSSRFPRVAGQPGSFALYVTEQSWHERWGKWNGYAYTIYEVEGEERAASLTAFSSRGAYVTEAKNNYEIGTKFLNRAEALDGFLKQPDSVQKMILRIEETGSISKNERASSKFTELFWTGKDAVQIPYLSHEFLIRIINRLNVLGKESEGKKLQDWLESKGIPVDLDQLP